MTKLIIVSLLLTSTAWAGFNIEPSVGYKNSKLKMTDLSNSTTEFQMNGLQYGLKLGVSSPLGITLDVQGLQSQGKSQMTPDSGFNPEFSHTTGLALIGVSAMGLLKIHLGYIFMNDLELKSTDVFNGFKLKGQGYQAGITTYLFPRIGLSAIYNVNQFNKISGTTYTNGDAIETYLNKIDSQDFGLQLSVLF